MKRSAGLALVSVVAATAIFSADVLHAQQSRGSDREPDTIPLVAHRPTGPIDLSLDGRLDEAVWQAATPITDFTQQEPVEGGVPSEETEIRVIYDDDNLYIGAIIYDDPDGILAFQRERDAFLSTDDRFMWILDTFLDGRTGYYFEINAAGLMGDGILSGGGSSGRGGGGPGGGSSGGTSRAWDGIWEVRTFIRPDGWSAEIQIPFRTLNFDPNQSEWGINFGRTIRRKNNEEILWRGWRRTEGLQNPVFAGRLTGLQGMSQGVGLEAVPSAVANWRRDLSATNPDTFPASVSLDLNYSVTSSLRASVSINTDFAELESDQRRVNLTRFPLRFPERRDFFLEGAGVFSFAPSSGPTPFYSRDIGINRGQQVPITVGTRLTGQAGSYELGFYHVGTAQHEYFDTSDEVDAIIPKERFTIARVKRQLFEQSAIGAIYTLRGTSQLPGAEPAPIDRHTAGVDVDLRTRNFLGDKNLAVEAFVAWNSNPLTSGDPDWSNLGFGDLSSRGVRLNYPNDIWTGHVSYREFGDHYKPAVGFVTRNNFRRVEPRIGWSPRTPGISWLRRMSFSAQFRAQKALDTGRLEEGEWQFSVLDLDFESGDNVGFTMTRKNEYLDRQFDPSGGDDLFVVPGRYKNWEYRFSGRTTSRRRVSMGGSFNRGGFWDGTRNRTDIRASFRPRPGISLSTNFEYNDVTMPDGAFTVSVYEVTGDWNPPVSAGS
jgi:hypothetical protein